MRFPSHVLRLLAVLLLCTAGAAPLSAQWIESLEFHDKPITDILLALGEAADRSIIADGTVTGRASYYFSDMEFDRALKVFLDTYNLYLRIEDGIYYVSRVRAEYDARREVVRVDAEEVEVLSVIHALSKAMGRTILYDPLPPETVTLHARDLDPRTLLGLIVKRLGSFELESGDDYFYIRRRAPARPGEPAGPRPENRIEAREGRFSLEQTERPLFDLLDELFRKAEREYSLITRRNEIVGRVSYRDKPFDRLLRLVLNQFNMDFRTIEDIYYVFDISQQHMMNKLRSTVAVPLIHTTTESVMKLFPPEMLAGRIVRPDPLNNSLLLTGTPEEIDPVRDFIRRVDRPVEENRYHRFDLDFVKAENIQNLLPAVYRTQEVILIPGTNSFAMQLTEAGRGNVEEYLGLIDRSTDVSEIHLRYVQAEDLTEHLPPSVSEEDIIVTGDPSVVFFRGSKEKQEIFRRELAVLDQPVPQIQYQLLVVQFSEGSSLNWQDQENTLFSFSYPESGYHSYSGNFGNLLDLNFDVFSTLGAKLSMDLNLALSTNRANVLTDTTLNSLSGQTVSFQDTDTFRYQELEIVDGETRNTGVTREVSTGLIVSIEGWASGDGMITMKVDATVSKQGVDTSSSAGNLPPTTEKKVATQVRTFSGSPVILSGLYRWDETTVENKIPVLGDIPVLGLLFKSQKETKTKSEVAIFIMPRIETADDDGVDAERRIASAYDSLFHPAVERAAREEETSLEP